MAGGVSTTRGLQNDKIWSRPTTSCESFCSFLPPSPGNFLPHNPLLREGSGGFLFRKRRATTNVAGLPFPVTKILELKHFAQGPLNGGGVQTGGFPVWTCPSFFVIFCPFWDFPDFSGISPICSGMVRAFSRFVPFLFLSLSVPKGSATQSGPFPKKVGNPPA